MSKMKFSAQYILFNYLILLSAMGISVKGKARFVEVPPNPLYISNGGTARIVWDYTVQNKTEEFQLISPVWNYYYSNGTAVNIGYEHFLRNWSWIINSATCPSRFLYPTIRVSKESTATLVITNVTTNDSGTYGMVLMLKTARQITSKTELIVTTRPQITSKFQASMIVIEGRELRLCCSANGIPTPNITWVLLKDQTKEIKSQGMGTADLIIQNITRHQNGTYQCQATNNPNEDPVENTTEVTIWYKPTITFLNWTVEENTILLCLASGQPHPSIKWYFPSGMQVESGITDIITDGSRLVLDIPDDNTGLYEVYKCNATNEVGWQVGYINVTKTNRPTTETRTERAVVTVTSKYNKKTKASEIATTTTKRIDSKTSIITHVMEKKETTLKVGQKTPKYKKNLNEVVLLSVFGVLIPIIVSVSVVFVLRKRCRHTRINKENRTDADDDNPRTVLPAAADPNTTYGDIGNIQTYAQVKKGTDEEIDSMQIYAQVDKTKKKSRPGQIIYAELQDIKSSTENSCLVIPPTYNTTEYAEIRNLNNRQTVNPEPVYETLPGHP